MPDIASLHPQVVHFVIALLIIGVLARIASLLPLGARRAFLNPMAFALIILGTAAAVVAVESGEEAHERVERVPGSRDAVEVHEEWGERTRNLFLIISAVEIGALALASRKTSVAHGLRVASAVLGIVGLWVVYEAGDHGGDLAYNYAGGIGLRSGDSTDVRRLLVAGLYHNAQLDRQSGNKAGAAALTDQLGQMMPNDPGVQLLEAESMLRDRGDPARALAALAAMQPSGANRGVEIRRGLLMSAAYDAAGQKDSARVVLQALQQKYPNVRPIQDALKKLE